MTCNECGVHATALGAARDTSAPRRNTTSTSAANQQAQRAFADSYSTDREYVVAEVLQQRYLGGKLQFYVQWAVL